LPQFEGFRDSGIEELKDKINKLKEIEFLASLIPELEPRSNFHAVP